MKSKYLNFIILIFIPYLGAYSADYSHCLGNAAQIISDETRRGWRLVSCDSISHDEPNTERFCLRSGPPGLCFKRQGPTPTPTPALGSLSEKIIQPSQITQTAPAAKEAPIAALATTNGSSWCPKGSRPISAVAGICEPIPEPAVYSDAPIISSSAPREAPAQEPHSENPLYSPTQKGDMQSGGVISIGASTSESSDQPTQTFIFSFQRKPMDLKPATLEPSGYESLP